MNAFLSECESRGIECQDLRDYSQGRRVECQAIDWTKLETLVLQAFVQILKQMIPIG